MAAVTMTQLADSNAGWSKGITLSVVASVIGAASKLAIRKSFLMDERGLMTILITRRRRQHYQYKQQQTASTPTKTTSHVVAAAACLRLSGMLGMAIFNPLCGVLAMNYASPSLVAPFSGLDLVWVISFSHALVGEDPTSRQIVAASLVVAGEALSAVFGDHTNNNSISDSYSTTAVVLQDLVKSYQDPAFLAYHVAFVLWMLLMVHWMRLPPANHQSPMLQRFAWGVLGGSVMGLQHFVKDWLTLIHAMVRSHNDRLVDTHDDVHDIDDIDDIDCNSLWCNPLLVLSILAVFSMMTAIGGLLLLTACMQRYNATFLSAMFVGSFVLNSSIISAVHYHTFSHLNSRVCWILYPVGLLILMAGVVGILVSSSTPSLLSLSNGPDESQNNAVDESLHGLLLMASHNDTMKQGETLNVPNGNDDRCCHSPLQLFRSLQETRGKYLLRGQHYYERDGGDGLDPEKCVSKYGACGSLDLS